MGEVIEKSHDIMGRLIDNFDRLLVQVFSDRGEFVRVYGESKGIHSAFESPEWIGLVHLVPAR